jgi:uncharacterized protein (DUF58 family)
MNSTHPEPLKLRSPLVPILTGTLLVMQLLDPSRIWLALLVSLGMLWLICYVWARQLAKNLRLEREIRFGWAQVGDFLEEKFTLHNGGWAPAPWVVIQDRSTLPGSSASQVRGIEGHFRLSWQSRRLCTQRGVFRLGPTTLKAGDPFGLYQVILDCPASTMLVIMPPVVPLPLFQAAPGSGSGEGRPRREAAEKTLLTSSVREFHPGDSLHRVHWRTTARKDELFVRNLEGTSAGSWWILLDLDRQVHAGEGFESTLEHAVILAASLADWSLREQHATGLAASGEELTWIPPKHGGSQRLEILRGLALMQTGDCSLGKLLERCCSAIEKNAALLIITTDSKGDWLKSLLPLVWKGVVPTVLLLDQSEFRKDADETAGMGVQRMSAVLTAQRINHVIVPKAVLERPEARPGEKGHWEWRVTPRGKAVLLNKPEALVWRSLS